VLRGGGGNRFIRRDLMGLGGAMVFDQQGFAFMSYVAPVSSWKSK
jgi:hypothetical protein